MDATASPQIDADINDVYGLFLKIENSNFRTVKPRSTVIKYTKLPEFEYDRKGTWPSNKYSLTPRVRRIISIEGPTFVTSRSLCADILASSKTMTSNITQRKIVTITEDDENDLHPKFAKKPAPKITSRSVGTDLLQKDKYFSKTTASRLAIPKNSKELKSSPRGRNVNSKDSNVLKPVPRSKYSNVSQPSMSVIKQAKGKDAMCNTKSDNISNISINTNSTTKSVSEKEVKSYKRLQHFKSNSNISRPSETSRSQRAPIHQNVKGKLLKKIASSSKKPVTIIHVPLEDKYQKYDDKFSSTVTGLETEVPNLTKSNCSMDIEKYMVCRNVDIGTDPTPTEDREIQMVADQLVSPYSITEENKRLFDSLKIPNVTLTKDRSEHTEEIVQFHSKSLPNLKVPALQITPSKLNDKSTKEPSIFKSYIISSATVTCTTRQKINFEVVGSNNDSSSEQSTNKLAYPMNVVSVYKKKLKNTESNCLSSKNTCKHRDKSEAKYTNQLNEFKSLNYSYVFNSSKLVKPSDIISTIRFNSLLQSDYISEQFQRELNFIDSFFESLQYLESCSFPDKGFSDNKVQSWVHKAGFADISPDYGSFLSKLENGTNVDDSETMASKSLCLLNLLIRDEQRRAKNLLFVLKMREDALKDFTKSQILWLEDKKKQDNTDISTLKKKQRGALLKLQHECGEMQRMRKALLTLTEKRKVALMKTKKNIELKLSNSLNVDQILLGKKKLKKGVAERITVPLKCFDLSSSGCDDSGTARPKAEMPLSGSPVRSQITSVEKSIQTGDSILETALTTDTAAENFIVVDGGYLNILFHNLSLPQIFSHGKHYEVNEEALRNIVHSSNVHNNNFNQTDVIENFMDHMKNSDVECSTPSTARSLVEEMDQYYKDLTEGDKLSDRDYAVVTEVKDSVIKVLDYVASPSDSNFVSVNICGETVMSVDNVESSEHCESVVPSRLPSPEVREEEVGTQTGPLPVPAGAVATVETQQLPDVPLWLLPTSSTSSMSSETSNSSQPLLSRSMVSLSGMASPVHEAEELRRQQLAIEREIKALEQQQCQLVVREIPDKPPPPYTPPTESRLTRNPRMYLADETTSQRVHKYITNPNLGPCDPTDAFDVFVNDFCNDTIRKHRLEDSDKPWDACNLLPQKQPVNTEKLLARTSEELVDVFTGVAPTVVSGVASRRSDHIEDILFTEWRRCEPEWTTLHNDEVAVKNQLFESIFQRILTETIDEYKRIVQVEQ
ncbi:uncharacterized protein LOC128682933 isoform X2 [Plodia interpunctella]|uniref:uncharacterized protein LOC128682933 isoform X2 n=1 Tax=Plodia interpunctella TaxID=58824 RepID=UPI0023677245|nr:uncharacterized protein LOC128682933 isoform X2 [Plodia interpunctella]